MRITVALSIITDCFHQTDFQFFLVTRYGDMPAHNLLWRACEKSSDNVAARLAVIPLVQVVFFSWVCIFVIVGIVRLD